MKESQRKFDKRIINLKTQNEHIRLFIENSDAFVEAQLNPVISKSFSESVSLAISQVNGCKLCSYTHAKNALKSGMSEEEVEFLMSGGFDNVPKEQLEALLFAQHYADTNGNPDPEVKQKLVDVYGQEQTKDIMASILMMNLTNLHGNTTEALGLRLKGKPVEYSNFWQEVGVTVNFFRIMPVILYKMMKYKLLGTKRERLVFA
ncbi:MAG: alkylhydroperoxidase [Bacteroidetes bacterium 4572_77]|nr:MAG: alkylhydroperoxidase [Bacteroidetes bacterium 4572_77]